MICHPKSMLRKPNPLETIDNQEDSYTCYVVALIRAIKCTGNNSLLKCNFIFFITTSFDVEFFLIFLIP